MFHPLLNFSNAYLIYPKKFKWQNNIGHACKSRRLESGVKEDKFSKIGSTFTEMYSACYGNLQHVSAWSYLSPMSRATSLQIFKEECGNRHAKMSELWLFLVSLINHLCLHKAQGKVYWNQYKPFSFGSRPLSVFLLLLSLLAEMSHLT